MAGWCDASRDAVACPRCNNNQSDNARVCEVEKHPLPAVVLRRATRSGGDRRRGARLWGGANSAHRRREHPLTEGGGSRNELLRTGFQEKRIGLGGPNSLNTRLFQLKWTFPPRGLPLATSVSGAGVVGVRVLPKHGHAPKVPKVFTFGFECLL